MPLPFDATTWGDQASNVTSPGTSTFDHINPLYGPGSLIGWCLALLGTITVWLFHPPRASRDSIDPDFVICLTLPVLAVGHTIALTKDAHANRLRRTLDQQDQSTALYYASRWIVLRHNVDVSWARCRIKRSLSSALVGMACWTADYCSARVILEGFESRAGPFWPRIILTMMVCGMYCLGPIASWKLRMQKHRAKAAVPKQTDVLGQDGARLQVADSTESGDPKSLDCKHGSMIAVAMVATFFLAWNMVTRLTELVSRRRSNLADLEQVAAISGGATVLVLNLYSVVRYFYQRLRHGSQHNVDTEAGCDSKAKATQTHHSSDSDPEEATRVDAAFRVDVHIEPFKQPAPNPEAEES